MKKIYNLNEDMNQGITLIALVITIIVLLILAGISIASLTGENGILNKASQAGEKTIKAQLKEEIELAIIEIQAEELPKGRSVTLETLVNGQLTNKLQDITATLENNEIIGEYKGYDYTIDDKFNVIIGGQVKGISIEYELNNQEYTNQDITLTIHATSTNGEITKIEGPTELIKNGDNTYIVTQNGDYEFVVTDSTGQTKKRIIKITNIDKIGPIVELSTGKVTSDSIELIITANDELSGLAKSDIYKYYIENTLRETSTTNNYVFTGLTGGTTYNLKVLVTDRAGNEVKKEIAVTTDEIFKAGEYVNYIDKSGKIRKCIVLYGAKLGYGTQIVTEDIVENVGLGSSNFDTSMNSYNSAIETLNIKANNYLNTTYASSARCVGSVPNNPSLQASGYFTTSYSYFKNYNTKFKDIDTNYETDYKQMEQLGIRASNDSYWFASRYCRC